MTFSCYSVCQPKALGVTYSADMSRFSLSDMFDVCQTAACIYCVLFAAFFNTSVNSGGLFFFFFLVSASRVCKLSSSSSQF